MPMRPAGAAIWDVDGTLVDTAEMHFAAWADLAAEIGRPFSRADFAATFGRRNPEIIRAISTRKRATRQSPIWGSEKRSNTARRRALGPGSSYCLGPATCSAGYAIWVGHRRSRRAPRGRTWR